MYTVKEYIGNWFVCDEGQKGLVCVAFCTHRGDALRIADALRYAERRRTVRAKAPCNKRSTPLCKSCLTMSNDGCSLYCPNVRDCLSYERRAVR